jgi:hypothetical protein
MKLRHTGPILAVAVLALAGCGATSAPATRSTAAAPEPAMAMGGTDSKTSSRFALDAGTYRIAWMADGSQHLSGEAIVRGGGEAEQAAMPVVALVSADSEQTVQLPAGHYAVDVALLAPAGWTLTFTKV